jgi:hypothetical protein
MAREAQRDKKGPNKIDVPNATRHAQNRRRNKGVLYGTPTNDSDPGEVLLQEIRRTAGHIEWLRMQLSHSDPELFVKSLWLRGRQSGWIAPSELDTNDWSAAGALWVELYQSERKHLASICRTALAAGIEERRIRLAERMAERIGEAIRGMLYDLGLDPEDDAVRSIVYKWLSNAQGLDVQPGGMAIEG